MSEYLHALLRIIPSVPLIFMFLNLSVSVHTYVNGIVVTIHVFSTCTAAVSSLPYLPIHHWSLCHYVELIPAPFVSCVIYIHTYTGCNKSVCMVVQLGGIYVHALL